VRSGHSSDPYLIGPSGAPQEIEVIMQKPDRDKRPLNDNMPAPDVQVPNWAIEIEALLTRAAEMSVQHDVDPGAFMRGAWAAYVESRPDLRAHLEEMELRNQLDELRNNGVIGQA
jgi:hypothetical protein